MLPKNGSFISSQSDSIVDSLTPFENYTEIGSVFIGVPSNTFDALFYHKESRVVYFINGFIENSSHNTNQEFNITFCSKITSIGPFLWPTKRSCPLIFPKVSTTWVYPFISKYSLLMSGKTRENKLNSISSVKTIT